MKKTAAVLLLSALVFAVSVTSFGQKSRSAKSVPVADFVQFQEIRAYSDGQGTLIRWYMALETRNVGFYVYRVTPEGLQMIKSSFIGGFATKTSQPTGVGEKYEFFDTQGTLESTYLIQALSVDGRRFSTGTFGPKITTDFVRDTGHPKEYYEQTANNTNGDLEHSELRLSGELQQTVSDNVLLPDPNMHHWVVAQPGAKIAVKQDGMYRVLRSELESAGFNVNSNSTNWRLFMEGNEQGLIIGANDQYIEFYGRGIDTPETDQRVYYLIADTVPGKRIPTKILRPFSGNVVSNNFAAAAVKEERLTYSANIKNGDLGNYFGTFITSDPSTVNVILTNIDFGAATANLNIKLQGLFNGAHSVHAMINGHEVGLVNGNNQVGFSADFVIPTSFLVEGGNALELETISSNDFAYVDTITTTYPRKYVADQNRLAFSAVGNRKIEVTSFTGPNIRVFDITYDANPQLILNPTIVDNGNEQYSVKLPADRSAVMYAVDKSAMLSAASVTFNNPSTLASTANSANVIIISYSAPDFMAAAQSWKDYRQSAAGGNFTVKVVDVADIYDEFNYGSQSANSIRDFLQYAKANWQAPTPHYVLLLGDASYDPRNFQNLGNWDLVPTKLVDLIYGESGSDEGLADFDHDGLADMAVGRIPARSFQQVSISLNKTMAFETGAMQDLQSRGAVFAHDMPLGFDFEAISFALAAELPPRTRTTFVSRGLPPPNPQNEPDPNAHQNLIAALNTGPFIVNFAGHGALGTWAADSFFNVNHVPELTNPDQSIYTMLTCLSGYFIRPSDDSLAEVLVKSQGGGAVAAWASTTDTTPDLQLLMGVRFYNQIGMGEINRMGDLVVDAKATIPAGSDVTYSWVLFGDPALKVR